MDRPTRSSRRRYVQYRADAKAGKLDEQRSKGGGGGWGPWGGELKRRKRSRSAWTLFREFWRLLAGNRALLIAAVATLSLSVLIGLVPPYGSKLIFDSVLAQTPRPPEAPAWLGLPADPKALLWTVVLAMIGIQVVSMIVGTWSRWQATKVTKRVQADNRTRAFAHAARLPLHRIYDIKSGGVTSLLRDDAASAGELVFSMIYNPGRAIVQLLGSLAVLTVVDWRLLVGAVLFLPVVWLTHRTWINRIRPVFRDVRNTRQTTDAHATEAFGGMRVVRSFGRQRTETGTFAVNADLMIRQEILAWWWSRGIDIAWGLLIPLATSLLMLYGGTRILADNARVAAGQLDPRQALTVGDLVMFIGYLGGLLGPIAALAQSATGFQNNLAGLDKILDLLQEPIEMVPRPGAKVVTRDGTRGRVTFRDVSFKYANTDKLVLADVNLDVQAGQTVALVGPSGAGKTTLCNLVARFYDPTAGSVLLDGVDLRDVHVDSYRRLLGIVEQDTFLFDGTIADNIRYCRRHATREEVEHAARLANAHDFVVGLEKGYATYIGERGVKLSGGQRQRLTIARAILADPKILILDEATSNLDTESERLIQTSLQALMRHRTSFVIAHRLSTIVGADRILVLEGGRVVEDGTHDELMARSGRYRHMVDLQTRPPDPPKEMPFAKRDHRELREHGQPA